MDKLFKYIIAVLIVCTLIGIFIALNRPRPKLTFNDKIRLSKIIAECNADLPREIGTIGYLDSMSFADETITYAVSVKGDDRIMQVYSDNYDEFKDIIANKPGFVKAMWCGDRACEDKIKEETTATSRCMPFAQEHLSDVCVCCGRPAKKMVYWGKAY